MIFDAMYYGRKVSTFQRKLLPPGKPYSSALKVEVAKSSETLVLLRQTSRRQILEDSNIHRHENLKSQELKGVFKMLIFWEWTPCSSEDRAKRFGSSLPSRQGPQITVKE
jgi:hypothetical protein